MSDQPTYLLLPISHGYGPAIQCLVCGLVSYHPADVRERYCANCYRFHEDLALVPRATAQNPEKHPQNFQNPQKDLRTDG